MALYGEYGVAKTFYFPLIDAGAQDFESTPVTHASGDTQISKDGGAFANTTNAFAHEGNGIYSLALTATEMEASQIVVTIIDSATKAWEDQALYIETIGDSGEVVPGSGTMPLKNQAFTFNFVMRDSTNQDPTASLTITDTVSKDGAAFGACTGTVTEIANGVYEMAASAADMNGNVCTFRFTATGAEDTLVTIYTTGSV